MRRWILLLACAGLITGCTRYNPIEMSRTAPKGDVESADAGGSAGVPDEESGYRAEEGGRLQEESGSGTADQDNSGRTVLQIADDDAQPFPKREPVKVKGIYISAYVAGTEERMNAIIKELDETELNAVVIDFKDDEGRITAPVDSAAFDEIGACKKYIPDMEALIGKLKEHGIYVIARVVTFRDPYLAEKKPEWSLKKADGSVYRDRQGLAWVNPYKEEVWEYLAEVGRQAAAIGFDEVQFDYIRFSTDSTMKNVVFDEADTEGRSRTDIITEFTQYIYRQLAPLGVFVSADVFGTIIGSDQDAQSVGQIYGELAQNLDYICPMLYPSHYSDGNFGLDHPDLYPYETVLGALHKSAEDLALYRGSSGTAGGGQAQGDPQKESGGRTAIVRPWLQDFTASYLDHYIHYGEEEVGKEIQAVYDAGYDEWILWSASNRYHYGALQQ